MVAKANDTIASGVTHSIPRVSLYYERTADKGH